MIAVGLGLGGLLLMIAAWAVMVEPRRLRLTTHRVELAGLAGPVRLLLVSDTHFRRGNRWKLRLIRRIARVPGVDLLLLGGDLTEFESGLPVLAEALEMLHPGLGTLAIKGNHEHYRYGLYHAFNGWQHRGRPRDPTGTTELFRRFEVEVLENESRVVDTPGGPLTLVGIGDRYTRNHDPDRALQDATSHHPRIGLTHSPEVLQDLPHGSLDLLLAGHTHGGQVWLPILGPVASRSALSRRLIRGRYEEHGMTVIVGSGLGEGFYTRFRFRCPPEAVVIDLVPAP